MNQYTLDGVPLKDPTLKWHPTRETGIRILPARRQAEQRFPGVDGLNFIPGAPYDPGSVGISLQVTGNTYKAFRENVEFITGLFAQRHKVLELREHYDTVAANDRIAGVTLAASVEPVMIDRQTARVGAVFSVPQTFWQSGANYTGEVTSVTNSMQSPVITQLAGGNAPVDDMYFRIRGGTFGSMIIEDPVTGNKLNINTGLAAGQTLLIDPKNWNAITTTATGDTWSVSGGNNVSGLIVPNKGYGSMFSVEPARVGMAFAYSVRVWGTNVTGTPTLEIRAKKSYL